MRILVTGATGNVGGALVGRLADSGHEVRALVRNPDAAALPPGVDVVAGDLTSREDVRRALDGVDRAFLLLADDNGAAFAEVAGEVGLSHVVLLSSFTAVVQLPPAGANVVSAKHRAGEEALAVAGVTTTVLRPAGFDGGITAWTSALNESVVRSPYLDVALPIVDPDDIAACAVAILLADIPPTGPFSLTGPRALTITEQTATLGEVLGRPLRTELITERQAKDTVFPPGFPDLIASSILATASPAAAALRVSADILLLTGQAPRSFARWALAHRADFV